MGEEDFRIIESFKQHSPAAFKSADKDALDALKQIAKKSPKADSENFMYWILINYYTYQVTQEIIKNIEERSKQKA